MFTSSSPISSMMLMRWVSSSSITSRFFTLRSMNSPICSNAFSSDSLLTGFSR
jgi:hypothetical protein